MKTALITGGSGDIGKAIVSEYTQQGYQVFSPPRGELDLRSASSIESFCKAYTGPLDVLVHCAGHNQPVAYTQLSEAEFETTFDVNARAFYRLTSGLSRYFIQSGERRIIGISSLYGTFSRSGRFAYATSKHALNGMIQTLALDWGKYGVLVNGVAPGFVDTAMTRKNNTDETISGFESRIPVGRLAKPEDIASVVFFLGSEKNRYINGQVITVDGGYSVGGFQA